MNISSWSPSVQSPQSSCLISLCAMPSCVCWHPAYLHPEIWVTGLRGACLLLSPTPESWACCEHEGVVPICLIVQRMITTDTPVLMSPMRLGAETGETRGWRDSLRTAGSVAEMPLCSWDTYQYKGQDDVRRILRIENWGNM